MLSIDKLRKSMETMFEIPFYVKGGQKEGAPCFDLVPSDAEIDESFTIHTEFQNKVRIIIEVILGKFSANMIRNMGQASIEKKKAFTAFANDIVKEGGKLKFMINENNADPLDFTHWTSDWKLFDLRFTKMPINSFLENIDYTTIAIHWTGLVTGMVLSLLDIVPIEEQVGYSEGKKIEAIITRYERNPLNRSACILAKGVKCSVCGMDFEHVYGEIGMGFIHVHHLIPVSVMGHDYTVDPVNDLTPVCPNCHAMLHKRTPPYSISVLKKLIKKLE